MQYEPLIADRYYHVFNCGNNRQPIFFEPRNYDYFLRLIEKYLKPVCSIYAYCLLPNHFHLLFKTNDLEDKIISQAFSNFFNSYAKAVNKAYNRTGSLFQDRFKRKLIQNEKYLRDVMVYIHLNPENHKINDDFKDYEYSSFKSLLSENSALLEKKAVFDLFGDRDNFEYRHLERKVEMKQPGSDYYFE